MKNMDCAEVPCSSCPYRLDTPPGVWEKSEYEKLCDYAQQGGGVPCLALFLCHQTHATGRETLCRGWLTVERDSIAVRLALTLGQVTQEQVEAKPRVPLYATGEAACKAGRAGIQAPTADAKRVIARLVRKVKSR